MSISLDLARRRFIRKAGTALAAPAALAVPAAHSGARSDDAASQARLKLFEEQEAIRAAARAYVRHVNGYPDADGELARVCPSPARVRLDAVRALTPDPQGAADVIELAADGRTATASLHYAAATESPIEPACPLVAMARAQGGGVLRSTRRGVLEAAFVKSNGDWTIERAVFRPA
jgi:hypothetical protein